MRGCLITAIVALVIAAMTGRQAFRAGYEYLQNAREEFSERKHLIETWDTPDPNAPLSRWFPESAGPFERHHKSIDNTLWGRLGLHGNHPGAVYRHPDGYDIHMAAVDAQTDAEREMVFSILKNHHERQDGNKSALTTPAYQRFHHGTPRMGLIAWRAKGYVIIAHGPANGEPESLLWEWFQAAGRNH